MNKYDEFEDVPPYLMAEDTDPSVLPDPDDEITAEDVVEVMQEEDEEGEEEDDDLIGDEEDDEEEVI